MGRIRKFTPLGWAVVALLLLLTGCGKEAKAPPELEVPDEFVPAVAAATDAPVQEDIEMYTALLYYSDGHGHLVPVSEKIAWQEGIAKATLYALAESPDRKSQLDSLGIEATLPEDIEIDLDIQEGTATVDLASENMPDDTDDQMLMIASVVNTLMEFDTVEKVMLLWNHEEPETYADGSAMPKEYTAMVANMETEGTPDGEDATVTLYFCNSTGDFLVPLERMAPQLDEEAAIEQLAQINSDSGLVSVLPEGCTILEVRIEDDTAKVNLSYHFSALSEDPTAEQLAYKAIARTLEPFDSCDNLELYVEGVSYEITQATMASGVKGALNVMPQE